MSKYKQDKELYRCDWFTNWFRSILGQRRITTDEFARMTGLGGTTVRDYRTGARCPTLRTFLMILDVMGLQIKIVEKPKDNHF